MTTEDVAETEATSRQTPLWFARTIAALFFKILLPILDLVTDAYTLNRYYHHALNKPLMMSVFRASFLTILFHNAVSTWLGLAGVRQFHARLPLATWTGAAWQSVTVALHALGIGGIIVPVEALLVVARFNRQAAAQRYADIRGFLFSRCALTSL